MTGRLDRSDVLPPIHGRRSLREHIISCDFPTRDGARRDITRPRSGTQQAADAPYGLTSTAIFGLELSNEVSGSLQVPAECKALVYGDGRVFQGTLGPSRSLSRLLPCRSKEVTVAAEPRNGQEENGEADHQIHDDRSLGRLSRMRLGS